MKYYYKSHSILGEKITVVFNGLIYLFSTSFLTFISIKELSWIGFSFSTLSFLVLIYLVYSIISIFRNTVDYTIIFFDNYFKIKSRKYNLIIDYSQIITMSLKRNYSFISSGRWLYLEIECGLTSPVYVNYSYLQENKLRDITDENFIKHFETIRKWTRIIEPRNKNNIL